ncbi:MULTISPECIES: TonB-dependent receptor domain-containing protein [unclassified Providencia]|uniref:TonB-dependent receptor domain-containing protein n=1 Tax=Providencia TaxID=586 RepID=UPI00234B177F|nr:MULTISPECIES: TonB-dependent receptor [unclassified Providencia]ELR5256001.1 TonB-dependent receptor [Providencia rettgeri]
MIFQNKNIISLLVICSSGTVLADEANTVQQKDKLLVTASKIKSNSKRIETKDISVVRGTTNSDIFANETSLQINNARNEAGALDIGIRGLQGNGRVPIIIDGSLQSTNTWRGYQGSTDRTYIDMDLVDTIEIEKGASMSKFSGGAIGGTVKLKTLSANSIIPQGEQFGFLFKGNIYNNNRRPSIASEEGRESEYRLSNGVKNSHFNNGSITTGIAYRNDKFDVLIAHSDRKQGNFFAGKNGYHKYSSTDAPIKPGQEVVNTSYESQSTLLKTNIYLNPYSSIELNYRRHEQQAGEVLAAYWYQYDNKMPQWSLGTANIDTASLNYSYKPDSLWVDMNLGVWWTKGKFKQRNGTSDNVNAHYGDQYKHRYTDERLGFNLENTSELAAYPIGITYGVEYMQQKSKPLSKTYQPIWTPDGTLEGDELTPVTRNAKGINTSAFTNVEYQGDWVTALAGWRIHSFDVDDHVQGKSLHYGPKNDLFGELRFHMTNELDIYTKYSDSYREPSLFETTASGQTYSYSPNSPLKPEHAKSFEVGMNLEKNNLIADEDVAELRVAYFNNDIKDYLSQGVNPKLEDWSSPYVITKNYDRFKLSGYEVELKYNSNYAFGSVDATFYNNAELCSRDEMALGSLPSACNSVGFAWGLSPSRIPPKKVVTGIVGVKMFDQKLQTGLRVRYNSGKDYPQEWLAGTAAAPVTKLYSTTTFDLLGKYSIQKNIHVNFNIDNLTNRYAFDPGTVIYMPIPGRTFRLGLEATF